ncbi:Vacuolar protein-sorting-associated protein 36 [Chamberlinius hualienensis]
MDRFQWSDGVLGASESVLTSQNGIGLYDGDEKTSYNYGDVILTTHKLEWKSSRDSTCISLPLQYLVYIEDQPSSLGKSARIILHLNPPISANRLPGPVQRSPNSFVQLSFKEGGKTNFYQCLQSAFTRRIWEQIPSPAGPAKSLPQTRAGIVGIERVLQDRQKATSKNISIAFEDLNKLMEMARDMVTLAKTISTKIKEKQGEISEDETVQFKSYLLSLGISDPVTKETHGTGSVYYRELAKQLAKFIEQPLKDAGGMMVLTDVYCRFNRARGLELISPEDLIHACKALEQMKLSVCFRIFDSGVMALQLASQKEEKIMAESIHMLEDKKSLTAEEFAQLIGIPVVLAKERLLLIEKNGGACRDDSVEGLRFYPNLFLTFKEAV